MQKPATHPASVLLLGLFIAAATACDQTPTESDPEMLDDTPPGDTTTVVARGDRVLAISISDRSDGDFNSAFGQAAEAGMQATSLSLSWDDLEVSPGIYDPAIDFLQIAADYYPSRNTRLVLGINPIDTNNRRVPAHLEGLAWNDPQMVSAFKDLLDWALEKAAPLDLVVLSIGNEIDATLASSGEWEAYREFHAQVAAHAKSVRPGLRVGAKVTKDGVTGGFADEAASLFAASGLVLTTYYPLGDGFQIQPPTSVDAVFDDIASRFPTLPVLFAEIGSPSTSACGSSEALQAEFVRRAFGAWDRHAGHIELLDFVWMHDISDAALDVYEQYYGLSDACFLDYLGTLGLKRPNGDDKPAWVALEEEASRRGW